MEQKIEDFVNKIFYFQDLKKIEQKQDNNNLIPVNHPNTSLPGDSKLKSELTLLQRKYNRLEQKEKRIQVIFKKFKFYHFYFSFISNYVVNGKQIMIIINFINYFSLLLLVQELN